MPSVVAVDFDGIDREKRELDPAECRTLGLLLGYDCDDGEAIEALRGLSPRAVRLFGSICAQVSAIRERLGRDEAEWWLRAAAEFVAEPVLRDGVTDAGQMSDEELLATLQHARDFHGWTASHGWALTPMPSSCRWRSGRCGARGVRRRSTRARRARASARRSDDGPHHRELVRARRAAW